jgi:hypothetical protein
VPDYKQGLLRNGGFEVRTGGWELPKNGQGAISKG